MIFDKKINKKKINFKTEKQSFSRCSGELNAKVSAISARVFLVQKVFNELQQVSCFHIAFHFFYLFNDKN